MAEEEGSEISKEETQNGAGGSKGRSCKGCLYYSSQLKGNQRNPLCVGFSRALQQVPNYVEPESDIEAASKEGRSLLDFKYACVGYSVFADKKDSLSDQQDPQAELPFCVGIELLVDRRASTAAPVHEHAHRKEEEWWRFTEKQIIVQVCFGSWGRGDSTFALMLVSFGCATGKLLVKTHTYPA